MTLLVREPAALRPTSGSWGTDLSQSQRASIELDNQLPLFGKTLTIQAVRAAQAELLGLRRSQAPLRSILTVGPGNGDELLDILTKAQIDPKGIQITAFEINALKALEFKAKFPGAVVVSGQDGLNADFCSAEIGGARKFDFVQSAFALNQMSRQQKMKFLGNCRSVLAVNGMFLLSDFVLDNYSNIPDRAEADPLGRDRLESDLGRLYGRLVEEVGGIIAADSGDVKRSISALERAYKEALETTGFKATFESRASILNLVAASGLKEYMTIPIGEQCQVVVLAA